MDRVDLDGNIDDALKLVEPVNDAINNFSKDNISSGNLECAAPLAQRFSSLSKGDDFVNIEHAGAVTLQKLLVCVRQCVERRLPSATLATHTC
jgi:hypothetical protein